ncbi:MAG: hypothetical protein A2020_12660 [Lentisphaerae bacterium GWF2_45_14]|nr:MAG: hypothetical protein A2020_12660 [Lentisphaerae bacterium GWF2_45_14]
MNFFKIVFSVCSGTGVFTRLIGVSAWKAVLHYSMLAFFCACFIALSNISFYSEKASEVSLLLEKVFGHVNISRDGVLPKNEPEKARVLDFGNDFALNYFPERLLPDADVFSESQADGEDRFRGIIWTPGIVFAWLKIKGGKVLAVPFIAQNKNMDVEILDKKEIKTWLTGINKAPYQNFNIPFNNLQFKSFASHAVLGVSIMTFIGYFVHIIFSAFLFSGVFSLVYSMIGNDNIPGLSLKRLCVTAVYAGIPGTVIASFFPAFNLPFFTYQSVYLACLLIYLITVLNSLKKEMSPPEDDEGLL